MRGQRPPPEVYPRQLRTVGDHLRKRRLDFGLRQKDVAHLLEVNKDTIRNWEAGRAGPALWQWPAIIRWLGHVPFEVTGDSLPLDQRLKAYRRLHGVSQIRLAVFLGVDPSTLWRWEHGKRPDQVRTQRLKMLFSAQHQPFRTAAARRATDSLDSAERPAKQRSPG